MSTSKPPAAVDILILGAGWLSTFLLPLCAARAVTAVGTSRTGRTGTLSFTFDPADADLAPGPFAALPDAHTVLITFSLTHPGAAARLVSLYRTTRHAPQSDPAFVLLGSTSMWDAAAIATPAPHWFDRHTPFTPTPRATCEAELLALAQEGVRTTVLNLAGLWGAQRVPRNWVARVAPSKAALRAKGSLHVIHGRDVARAVLAVHAQWGVAAGERWLLTDGRVYDWWDLAAAWGAAGEGGAGLQEAEERGPHARWVRELMAETGVRALPRDIAYLGRALDSRAFWAAFGLDPVEARLERECV